MSARSQPRLKNGLTDWAGGTNLSPRAFLPSYEDGATGDLGATSVGTGTGSAVALSLFRNHFVISRRIHHFLAVDHPRLARLGSNDESSDSTTPRFPPKPLNHRRYAASRPPQGGHLHAANDSDRPRPESGSKRTFAGHPTNHINEATGGLIQHMIQSRNATGEWVKSHRLLDKGREYTRSISEVPQANV